MRRAARVAKAWRTGVVVKRYRALVTGVPSRDAFDVDTPIGLVDHPRLGRVYAAVAAGKRSLTHVRVLGTREGQALVEATIPTGRPHQIRIHLAAAGHPLVGDPLYAVGGVPDRSRRCPVSPGIACTRIGSSSIIPSRGCGSRSNALHRPRWMSRGSREWPESQTLPGAAPRIDRDDP